MKKLILLSAVLCLVSTISAQIRFGVKAGTNLSQLYVSGERQGINAEQYKGRVSYHFGGMMEYSLSEMFAIQPEFMYTNAGANLKSDNSFGMTDGHITINTLQLPVNLKASFPLGNNKLFVYAGPYVGYNLYGKAKGKINGKTEDTEIFTKGSNMKRWDYGVGIGVGMEVKQFVVSLNNQIGLADINGAKDAKMKSGNISLSVGYFF
ncbi:porin family protein [Prevotella sp. 10(H)]|uniref:porin family protein n=1 Tax=Prevotella sp. 10(H) TaxID=1158294 RepID=UPI0004A70EA3|nr:porin family protein [Prevotella sp. 10(H)]